MEARVPSGDARHLANPDYIRDQAQVFAMCQWARDLDGRGELGALFDKPDGLGVDEERVCTEEEGWILGLSLR
ncbi:MAG: hypothetical protein JRJ85_14595 [Deltaproteobacteria bacterium]|nr:hypothetical protein [Deltaproteobacteria bacterium]